MRIEALRKQELNAAAKKDYEKGPKPRAEILKEVMERKADLARAGRQWEKRNERIRERIAWDRKVMRAEQSVKRVLRDMSAGARNILRRRKKTTLIPSIDEIDLDNNRCL